MLHLFVDVDFFEILKAFANNVLHLQGHIFMCARTSQLCATQMSSVSSTTTHALQYRLICHVMCTRVSFLNCGDRRHGETWLYLRRSGMFLNSDSSRSMVRVFESMSAQIRSSLTSVRALCFFKASRIHSLCEHTYLWLRFMPTCSRICDVCYEMAAALTMPENSV